MKQINNGFSSCYWLDEQGNVFNDSIDRYLKRDKNSYNLRRIDGTIRSVSIKELYKLVYNKVYCRDNIKLLSGEIFKEIRGTEGNYFVSNKGRVKSYIGYNAKILKPSLTKKGYYRLQILQEGQRLNKLIHSLVASEWLPEATGIDLEIHHKDFCKTNNSVDNLELLTKAQHIKKHKERKELENA